MRLTPLSVPVLPSQDQETFARALRSALTLEGPTEAELQGKKILVVRSVCTREIPIGQR